MRTSPFTAGAARITAMCCALRAIIPSLPKLLLEAELPLHPDRAGCGAGGDQPQHQPHAQESLHRARQRRAQITLYDAVDDHAEAAYVVETIHETACSGGKAKGGEFAVMYRTNAQSRLLEEAFLRAGLPYRLVGAQRFYGRREVKDLIAYLRLVQNPADEVSLARVINVPPRGIGDKTLVALQLTAQHSEITAGGCAARSGHARRRIRPSSRSFSGRGATVLADFGAHAGQLARQPGQPPAAGTV